MNILKVQGGTNNMVYQLKILSFVIFLFGCNSQSDSLSQEKVTIKQSYFASGKLKTEQEFIHDSIQHGIYKRYYENGHIEIEVPYRNNIKEGLVKAYYDTGEIESEILYKAGKIHGIGKWYYKNGSLEESSNFINGIRVGEGFDYYKNGLIKRYLFYADTEELYYISNYDENGNSVSEEGHGIINIFIDKDSLRVGENLVAEFIIVIPPNTEQKFFVGALDENYNIIERQEQSINTEENLVVYERQMNTTGIYKWGAVLQIIDKNTREVVEHKFTMDKLKIVL